MNKIVKILVVVLLLGVTLGCQKNVSKVSYAKFNEYFTNKEGYSIIDNTSSYDINVRKHIEAGNGNVQIFYVEYDSEKSADEYIKGLEEDENIKVTKYDKYTYAESKKGRYMVVYKIDSTVVVGMSEENKYRNEVNGVLRDLGY